MHWFDGITAPTARKKHPRSTHLYDLIALLTWVW